MSAGDLWLLVTVASLVLLAGAFSAADAALGSFSQARAGELAAEERAGSKRLLHLLEDAPRYLNTALLLRLASFYPLASWLRRLRRLALLALPRELCLERLHGRQHTQLSQPRSQRTRHRYSGSLLVPSSEPQ